MRSFTLNSFTTTLPELNNGAEIILHTALDEVSFKNQYLEIFQECQYKLGLDGLPDQGVVLDIGANMGLTSHYWLSKAKQVYSLEPSSIHFTCLEKNTQGFDKIKIFNLGLDGANGTEKLSSNDKGSLPESIYGDGEISDLVQMTTLDDFMTDQKLDHIDLMKIDCEGAEYRIFASKSFGKRAHQIDAIIGEAHMFEQLNPAFVTEMLSDYGFKLIWPKMHNLYQDLQLDTNGDLSRNYRVYFDTIFYATRS